VGSNPTPSTVKCRRPT